MNVIEMKVVIENLREEIRRLKKQLEELNKKLFFTKNELDMRQKSIDNKLNQQKEFIEYLENEKDRLSRECSQIYEDSLGKTRLVNEDIFNEVDKILSKYKEIIGG